MATLYHQVWIDAPAAKLYEGIATEQGIAAWWDTPTTVESEGGAILEFRPGPGHGVLKMKVLAREPDRRVEWECISTHPESSPASAWTGTRLLFEISQGEGVTILDFRHSGWDEHSRYFGFCNFAWGEALQKLQQWC